MKKTNFGDIRQRYHIRLRGVRIGNRINYGSFSITLVSSRDVQVSGIFEVSENKMFKDIYLCGSYNEVKSKSYELLGRYDLVSV